jgi:hypothetical protein
MLLSCRKMANGEVADAKGRRIVRIFPETGKSGCCRYFAIACQTIADSLQ